MTQPANPVSQPAVHRTLDPTPVPPERRGTEAPVSNDPGATADDIGGQRVKE